MLMMESKLSFFEKHHPQAGTGVPAGGCACGKEAYSQ